MIRTALILAALAGPAAAQQPPPFASFDLAGPAVLNDPHDLAFGPDGRLYVADKFGSRIAVLDPETLDLVEEIGPGLFPNIHDIAFAEDGRAAVAVTGLGQVLVFDRLGDGALPPPLVYAAPRTEGAVLHPNGRLYATAGGAGLLLAFQGDRLVAQAGGHPGAHDVAVDHAGNLWLADNFNRRLVKYDPDLRQLQVIDAPKFGLVGPRYLDVDDAGRLVVADQDAHRVLLIDPDGPDGGTLLGVLGDGTPGAGPNRFDDPEGVVARGSRYYVSDSDNNRVVRYVVVMN